MEAITVNADDLIVCMHCDS